MKTAQCLKCKAHKHTDEFIRLEKGHEGEVSRLCIVCRTADEVRGALCPRCKKEKLMKFFMTHLTREQALARGYASKVLVAVESDLCNVCRPNRKPLSKLSRKALHNKMVAGDISHMLAANLMAALKEQQVRGRSAGGYNATLTKRRPVWDALIHPLQESIAKARQRGVYARSKNQTEMAAFFHAYIEALKVTKINMQLCMRVNAGPPPTGTWHDQVTDETVSDLRTLWDALPVQGRFFRGVPDLFDKGAANEREDEAAVHKLANIVRPRDKVSVVRSHATANREVASAYARGVLEASKAQGAVQVPDNLLFDSAADARAAQAAKTPHSPEHVKAWEATHAKGREGFTAAPDYAWARDMMNGKM